MGLDVSRRKVSLSKKMKKGRRRHSPQYMSENGGRRASRNPEERFDRASGGNITGYVTQDEGFHGLTDLDPLGSANATLENTMGFRSSGRIPIKASLRKSGARTKSVTNMQRYGNESKLKLDHTSFI